MHRASPQSFVRCLSLATSTAGPAARFGGLSGTAERRSPRDTISLREPSCRESSTALPRRMPTSQRSLRRSCAPFCRTSFWNCGATRRRPRSWGARGTRWQRCCEKRRCQRRAAATSAAPFGRRRRRARDLALTPARSKAQRSARPRLLAARTSTSGTNVAHRHAVTRRARSASTTPSSAACRTCAACRTRTRTKRCVAAAGLARRASRVPRPVRLAWFGSRMPRPVLLA